MTEVTRDPRSSCPYCGYKTDAAEAAEGSAVPGAGDWSICFGCGRVAVFTGDGLMTRPATEAEEAEALAEPEIAEWRGRVLALLADDRARDR